MKQLFAGTFTNQQVLAASCTAPAVSVFGLWRLKMTGFAWTTCLLCRNDGQKVVATPRRSAKTFKISGDEGVATTQTRCFLQSTYLLVDLGIVDRKSFIIGLGFAGLLIALGTFAYVRRRAQTNGK